MNDNDNESLMEGYEKTEAMWEDFRSSGLGSEKNREVTRVQKMIFYAGMVAYNMELSNSLIRDSSSLHIIDLIKGGFSAHLNQKEKKGKWAC